jgi:hypothetical protein
LALNNVCTTPFMPAEARRAKDGAAASTRILYRNQFAVRYTRPIRKMVRDMYKVAV